MAGIIRDSDADVIEAGTLRLTWLSAVAAGIGGFITTYNDSFKQIFTDDMNLSAVQYGWIKAGMLAVIVLAIAAIVIADIVSRGYVSGKAQIARQVVPAPGGLKATLTEGIDRPGFTVVALRHVGSDKQEYLVVKDSSTPEWISGDKVSLTM